GRQAAIAGAPERALPFLAGAVGAVGEVAPVDRPSPVLSLLLGQARLAYAGLVALAPIDVGGTIGGGLGAGGRVLVTTSVNGALRGWDLPHARVAWTAEHALRIAVSPDGASVLSMGPDGQVLLRATADGHVLAQWPPPSPWRDHEVPALLEWAPAGDRFAIGTQLGRIVLGAPGAAALVEGEPDTGEVWTLRFAPDGSALATVAADGVMAIRDPVTGAIRARLGEAGAAPQGCAWRGPGQLVSIDGDHRARLWDLASGKVVRRFAHDYDLYDVAVSPDGAHMIVVGYGKRSTLWSLDDERPAIPLPGQQLGVDLAVFAGGRFVTADEIGGVRAWDPTTGELVASLPAEGQLHGISAQGDRLVLFGEGRPRVWRPGDDQALRRLEGHTARIRDLAFAPTGAVIWSASHDGSARGVDLATGATHVLGDAGFREPALLDPVAGTTPTTINPRGLRSLTLTPDGARVLTASEDGTIGVWDAATGAALATWRGHTGRVRKVIVTDDGRTAYSVGDTTLRRWDVASGRELGRATLAASGWDVALLGDRIATLGTQPPRVELWDAATLAPVPMPPFLADPLRNLSVVDGRLLVANDAQILLLDRDGRPVADAAHTSPFSAATGTVAGVAAIAIGDARGEVVLHDRTTLAPIRGWSTPEPVVAALAFRPDDAVLATAGGRGVQLWDPATGRELAATPELPALIAQLAWSPDGHTLAFAGSAGTVWLWRLPDDDGGGLAQLAACVDPLRLDQASLTRATFDPAACAALGH
ncbi:MAG TPA: hypothetical protein VHE35_10185, partial [Kofleriaceae bacterium]|nr:hypothetical protein [Kofleriaceae bacterium]